MSLDIGEMAVARGWITPEQIKEAYSVQEAVSLAGLTEGIEEILLKKGWLTLDQLQQLRNSLGDPEGLIPGYEILDKIGGGGMGTVYRGIRSADKQMVAVKILRPTLGMTGDFVARFLREAEVVRRLNHPNLVRGLDAGYQKGLYYFVMEYVEGIDLDRRIREHGPIPWFEALTIVDQVSKAMEYAASAGFVHLDLKPSNLIQGRDATVRVIDLGLARMVGHGGQRLEGTPEYMSPEQVEGCPDLDARSDIYSLGLVLFTMLMGRPPFRGATTAETSQLRLKQEFPLSKLLTVDMPEGVRSMMRKMCQRHRENRYRDWPSMRHDLVFLLQGRMPSKTLALPSEPQAGGLLGRIAVRRGFVSPAQLKEAIEIQDRLLQCGVRKPLGEILIDEKYLTRSELNKLLSEQRRDAARVRDVKLGELIVKCGIASAEAVEEASNEQARLLREEGFSQPIDQILVRMGRITEQQRKAVMKLARRIGAEGSSAPEIQVGVRECPNCLRVTSMSSALCSDCGFLLPWPKIEVLCVSCQKVQTQPGEVCGNCGASLATGRRLPPERLTTCSKCKKYCAAYQDRCAFCQAMLWRGTTRKIVRDLVRTVRSSGHFAARRSFVVLAVLGAFLTGIFWRHIAEGFDLLLGPKIPPPRQVAEEFLDAIVHDNLELAREFLVKPPNVPSESIDLPAIYRRIGAPGSGWRLDSFTLGKEIRQDTTATVYVDLFFVWESRNDPGVLEDIRKTTLNLVLKGEGSYARWMIPY